jgi:hypothetical protein
MIKLASVFFGLIVIVAAAYVLDRGINIDSETSTYTYNGKTSYLKHCRYLTIHGIILTALPVGRSVCTFFSPYSYSSAPPYSN